MDKEATIAGLPVLVTDAVSKKVILIAERQSRPLTYDPATDTFRAELIWVERIRLKVNA